MEDLINRILEIDENARKRLQKAYDEKAHTINSAEKQEEDIRTEVLKRVDGRLEKVEEVEKATADEKIEIIQKDKENLISMLDDKYNANHKNWEENIINNIISNN